MGGDVDVDAADSGGIDDVLESIGGSADDASDEDVSAWTGDVLVKSIASSFDITSGGFAGGGVDVGDLGDISTISGEELGERLWRFSFLREAFF